MPILHMVRHAKPAATWGEAVDPGLDDTGHAQAQTAAKTLNPLGPIPIYSSPLNRCRETAEPLCSLWQRQAEILKPVAEIPSPPLPLSEKQKWLHASMQGTWRQMQEARRKVRPTFSLGAMS
jgi:bisphosphoglycerate-dependent phosphoglycerate mutase